MAEAKEVAEHVRKASTIINNFSGDITAIIHEHSIIFEKSRTISINIIRSFNVLKEATFEEIKNNKEINGITKGLGADLINAAETGKQESAEAKKIQELSDDCNRKLQDARKTIERLCDESKMIEEISQTINEISDQTNLLSLNSSIESARAVNKDGALLLLPMKFQSWQTKASLPPKKSAASLAVQWNESSAQQFR